MELREGELNKVLLRERSFRQSDIVYAPVRGQTALAASHRIILWKTPKSSAEGKGPIGSDSTARPGLVLGTLYLLVNCTACVIQLIVQDGTIYEEP